jgi:hypothetical protein
VSLIGADLVRGAVAVPGDEPGGVVVGDDVPRPAAQIADGLEGAHPQEVLLERADEALGDAVAVGLADEGGRARDAEPTDLGLEVARQVVRAVVVAQRQPLRGVRGDATSYAGFWVTT